MSVPAPWPNAAGCSGQMHAPGPAMGSSASFDGSWPLWYDSLALVPTAAMKSTVAVAARASNE